MEVAFDPTKPNSDDYERFKVRFDVSKHLQTFKVVNLLEGGQVKLPF